jgi:hypothetical protein
MNCEDTRKFGIQQSPAKADDVPLDGPTVATYLLNLQARFRPAIIRFIPLNLLHATELSLLTTPGNEFLEDHSAIVTLLQERREQLKNGTGNGQR